MFILHSSNAICTIRILACGIRSRCGTTEIERCAAVPRILFKHLNYEYVMRYDGINELLPASDANQRHQQQQQQQQRIHGRTHNIFCSPPYFVLCVATIFRIHFKLSDNKNAFRERHAKKCLHFPFALHGNSIRRTSVNRFRFNETTNRIEATKKWVFNSLELWLIVLQFPVRDPTN